MIRSLAASVSLLAMSLASSPPVLAQTPDADAIAAPRVAPGYAVPRLSFGHPDLQGVWSNASNTRLTRPAQFKTLTLTQSEYEKAVAEHPQNIRQKTDDNQKISDGLLNGKDLASGRGYNAFWIDPGSSYASVKGTWRTSWIVDPPSGQIPLSDSGKKVMAETMATRRRGTGYDHPEERSLGERCIIQPTPGPPIGQYLYNNNLRIVQSPGHVVIQTEMINDARIVTLNGEHRSPDLKPWMGDSIGWWDGDTLVVETRNFRPESGGQVQISQSGKLIERFSRYSADQILYEFEVHDPALYSQVWKAEMSLNSTKGGIYEYACHEGNYGLHGILAGGRTAERNGKPMKADMDRTE